jgi:hypothetical protein
VNSECGFVEIAFELEAGGLDEVLVFGIVRNFWQVSGDIGATHPLQIDVKKSVSAGEQPCSLGRSVFAELDDKRKNRCDRDNDQKDGQAAAYAHVRVAAGRKLPKSGQNKGMIAPRREESGLGRDLRRVISG